MQKIFLKNKKVEPNSTYLADQGHPTPYILKNIFPYSYSEDKVKKVFVELCYLVQKTNCRRWSNTKQFNDARSLQNSQWISV